MASYPQYQQYPPPPPPPPPPKGSNKAVLIVFSVVVVLVVLGSGIFVVSRFAGGSDDSAGSSSTQPSSRVTDDTSPQPSTGGSPTTGSKPSVGVPSSQPSQPVASPSAPAAAPCNGCFAGFTMYGAVKQLKSKGFVCKDDRVLGMKCVKGDLEIDLDRDYTKKNYVRSVDVTGRASAKGEYPRGPRDAYTRMNAGLPGVLPWFIADAAVRQQIITFAAKNSAHAATGPAALRDGKAGPYRVSCHGVYGFTVRGSKGSASSYSTSVAIYGPSAY